MLPDVREKKAFPKKRLNFREKKKEVFTVFLSGYGRETGAFLQQGVTRRTK